MQQSVHANFMDRYSVGYMSLVLISQIAIRLQ